MRILRNRNKDGVTWFHIASTNNDVHTLNYLIEQKEIENLDIQNEEGWTPSHFAAFMNNYDSLNLLIESGSDLFVKNKHQMSVFDEIVRSNDDKLLECVYSLYKKKPRDLSIEKTFSLLHLAAGSDAHKAVKFLIEQGEDVNQICNLHDKATPLHFAILSNNFTSAKLLLNSNANPNAKDSLGNTPYHFAVSSKNRQLMQLLEESGGNALLENSKGISALDYAGIENVKAGKLFFMLYPRYRKVLKDNGYVN